MFCFFIISYLKNTDSRIIFKSKLCEFIEFWNKFNVYFKITHKHIVVFLIFMDFFDQF